MRWAVLALVLVAVGCGPRNKIGDRLLGRSSASNARSSISGGSPAPPP
jgi:hypothetical protein